MPSKNSIGKLIRIIMKNKFARVVYINFMRKIKKKLEKACKS